MDRRSEFLTVKLWQRGYGRNRIAEILDVPRSNVTRALKKNGIDPGAPKGDPRERQRQLCEMDEHDWHTRMGYDGKPFTSCRRCHAHQPKLITDREWGGTASKRKDKRPEGLTRHPGETTAYFHAMRQRYGGKDR